MQTPESYSPFKLGMAWGVCDTASAVNTKEVTMTTQLEEFSLINGCIFTVKFQNEVKAGDQLKLDNTPAFPIIWKGANLINNIISAGATVLFQYQTGSNISPKFIVLAVDTKIQNELLLGPVVAVTGSSAVSLTHELLDNTYILDIYQENASGNIVSLKTVQIVNITSNDSSYWAVTITFDYPLDADTTFKVIAKKI